jgi:hypothetical protein
MGACGVLAASLLDRQAQPPAPSGQSTHKGSGRPPSIPADPPAAPVTDPPVPAERAPVGAGAPPGTPGTTTFMEAVTCEVKD